MTCIVFSLLFVQTHTLSPSPTLLYLSCRPSHNGLCLLYHPSTPILSTTLPLCTPAIALRYPHLTSIQTPRPLSSLLPHQVNVYLRWICFALSNRSRFEYCHRSKVMQPVVHCLHPFKYSKLLGEPALILEMKNPLPILATSLHDWLIPKMRMTHFCRKHFCFARDNSSRHPYPLTGTFWKFGNF